MSDEFIMENPVQIRGGRNPVFAYTNDYKGAKYLHIREIWYVNNDESQPRPGRSGISFKVADAEDALAKVQAVLHAAVPPAKPTVAASRRALKSKAK